MVDNLDIGRPESVELIFADRRPGQRGRRPKRPGAAIAGTGRGAYKTKLLTRDTIGITLNAFYANRIDHARLNAA